MQQWQSRVWVSIGRELVMARTGEDVRTGKGRLFLFLLFFFSFFFFFCSYLCLDCILYLFFLCCPVFSCFFVFFSSVLV